MKKRVFKNNGKPWMFVLKYKTRWRKIEAKWDRESMGKYRV